MIKKHTHGPGTDGGGAAAMYARECSRLREINATMLEALEEIAHAPCLFALLGESPEPGMVYGYDGELEPCGCPGCRARAAIAMAEGTGEEPEQTIVEKVPTLGDLIHMHLENAKNHGYPIEEVCPVCHKPWEVCECLIAQEKGE